MRKVQKKQMQMGLVTTATLIKSYTYWIPKLRDAIEKRNTRVASLPADAFKVTMVIASTRMQVSIAIKELAIL
jgi:hypothetical protein